jgi:hypothetical protein
MAVAAPPRDLAASRKTVIAGDRLPVGVETFPGREPNDLVLGRAPWAGRAEDKTDDGVWACFLIGTASAAAASAVRSRAPPSTSRGNAAPVRSRATQ